MAYYFPTALSGTALSHTFSLSAVAPTPSSAPAYPQTPAAGPAPKKRKLTHTCTWEGCDRYFSCPHNVQQHIREAHTHERPFACRLCDKAFTRPFTLYRHMKGKHGIEDAAPGRGKGGGLARIGVEAPSKKKRPRPQAMEDVEMSDPTTPDDAYGSDGLWNDQAMDGQQPPTSEPLAFDVNNFTPIATACACGEQFDNREALLGHLHAQHDEPLSPHCNCMLCLGTFGGNVDAAGVHAHEKGAVMMRELMADDLFGGAEKTITKSPVMDQRSAVPVQQLHFKRRAKAPSTSEATAEALRSIGMTKEQFTASMPEAVCRPEALTPFLLNDETEAGSTAKVFGGGDGLVAAETQQMYGASFAQQFGSDTDSMECDDLDSWLKSAGEVFGGAEAISKYPSMS